MEDYISNSLKFPEPVDCVSNNRQQDTSTVPGEIPSAASCPTQPGEEHAAVVVHVKPASVPTKAPEAAACIDHMKETLNPQVSYIHVPSIQDTATEKFYGDQFDLIDVVHENNSHRFNEEGDAFAGANEEPSSRQALVLPVPPQKMQRFKNCAASQNELPANVLVARHPDESNEGNQAAVIDNTEDGGLNSDQMLKGAAVNRESMAGRNSKAHKPFQDVKCCGHIQPHTVIFSTDKVYVYIQILLTNAIINYYVFHYLVSID